MTGALLTRQWRSLTYGQTEALKWFAFGLMVNEHAWRYVVGDGGGWAWQLGRVVFPLFGFVLAVNVGRNWSPDVFRRVLLRLLAFGALAQPFSVYLTGTWRLNVLFTLAAGLVFALAFSPGARPRWEAGVAAGIVGAFCEFDVMGVLFVGAAVNWRITRSWIWGAIAAAGLCSLYLPNGNWMALAAIPIVMAARFLPEEFPRVRGLFYWLYPAHLAVLAAIASF